MAWTAPATWSVSEVVLASKMNLHVRDNLNYLKGNAGRVIISDGVTLPTTSGTSGVGLRFANAGTDIANVQSLDLAGSSYVFFATNRQFDGTAWQQLNARAAGLIQITQDAFTYSTFPAASSTPTARVAIDNAGNMGIGATTPQGPLHVKSSSTSGGMLFLSAAAVTTLQTLAIAGTVTQFALFNTIDRNNTGGAVVTRVGGDALVLGGSYTYTNTDNVTVTLTAGGAITVQRVSGTNGTHEVELLVLYK